MLFNSDNITIHTDASADELEVAVTKLKKDNGLIGLGEYFLKAQDDYNVNALILLAIACLESSYGLSDLAVNKNNLFGVDARDSLKGTSQYGRYFDSKKEFQHLYNNFCKDMLRSVAKVTKLLLYRLGVLPL